MEKYNIGIDVGGSHISCGLVDRESKHIHEEKIFDVKIDPKSSISQLLDAFRIVFEQINTNERTKSNVKGIGIAIPGPFDYKRGISRIAGVQKFDSLFGLHLKQALRSFPDIDNKPVVFLNDATAFALGEYYAGAARGSERTIVITLGTGLGSTFLINGVPQLFQTEAVPENGYLYNIPFKDSIADDFFSTRRFAVCWKNETGTEINGAKEVAAEVLAGNSIARKIFNDFADDLSEFILPWLIKYQPDTVVLGGSIAKAAEHFLPRLVKNLSDKKTDNIYIKPCELWDEAPIIGAAGNVENELNDTDEMIRKTEQFLAPEKSKPTQAGKYDIFPAFPLEAGKIEKGYDVLADKIMLHKTVVIDGYVGVLWDTMVQCLDQEFAKKGKNARWFCTDAAMRSSEDINDMLIPYLGEKDSIFGKITDKKLIDWFYPEKLTGIKPDAQADINILIGCGAALAGWDAPVFYADLPKNELQFRMRAGVARNLGADICEDNRQMYKRFYFVDWRVLDEHKCNILPRIDLIIDEQRPDDYLFMSGDVLRKGLTAMGRNFFRVRPWFEPGAWGGTWMKEHIEGLNKDVDNLAWSFELMVLENGIMFESDGYRLEVSFDFLMYNSYKEVLGDCAERFKYDFPIRFDFLDTFDGGNLSVQCHPRPEYIKKEFGMPFTQDETYYILDCKNKPTVYLGFQEGIDPDEFHKTLVYSQENAKEIDIERFVQKHDAKKHDFFLIPNGTIHASGRDNLVLEISSAPYIFTFKMYDWVRLDLDGRPRPINIDHGMKNLYFERRGKAVQDELICKPIITESNDTCVLEHLPTHPQHFYDVYRYSINDEIMIETKNKCHVWMLVEGESVRIETASGMKQRFNYAETFVIPAAAGSYKIVNEGKSKAMLLKAFVK